MRNTKEIVEELRKHSGLISEAADLIEKLQKENEFHKKTVQENAQKALEVTLEEIEKAKKKTTTEILNKIEKILDTSIALGKGSPVVYYNADKVDQQIAELRKEFEREFECSFKGEKKMET